MLELKQYVFFVLSKNRHGTPAVASGMTGVHVSVCTPGE
jgi:hypothetical protein